MYEYVHVVKAPPSGSTGLAQICPELVMDVTSHGLRISTSLFSLAVKAPPSGSTGLPWICPKLFMDVTCNGLRITTRIVSLVVKAPPSGSTGLARICPKRVVLVTSHGLSILTRLISLVDKAPPTGKRKTAIRDKRRKVRPPCLCPAVPPDWPRWTRTHSSLLAALIVVLFYLSSCTISH